MNKKAEFRNGKWNIQEPNKLKLFLGIALIILISLAVVLGATYLDISNVAHIDTKGSLSSNVTSIDWGHLVRPEVKTSEVIISNDGDQTISNLLMTLSLDLSPYGLTLTWDADGKSILGHASLPVTFTLTASAGSYLDGDCLWTTYIGGD